MKNTGTLTIIGTIDVNQFWPKGTSDADTVKLNVDPEHSFTFTTASGKTTVTSAFVDAWVSCGSTNDKTGKRKPKPVISSKNQITIRLQGIDTPELHVPMTLPTKRPPNAPPGKKISIAKKKQGDFRQFNGGLAAEALGKYIASFDQFGSGKIQCYFVSRVNEPSDICDSHGRFVGDIIVGISTAGKSVNTWLVENGWAHPLFYSSMTTPEIDTLISAWKIGKNIAGRPGKVLANTLLKFGDENRISRTGGKYVIPGYPQKDKGPVNFPKIFRRQAKFWVEVTGQLSAAEYYDKLKSGTASEHDYLCTLADYRKLLTNGTKPKRRSLYEFVKPTGKIDFEPIDLVFAEEPSKLHKGTCEAPTLVTKW